MKIRFSAAPLALAVGLALALSAAVAQSQISIVVSQSSSQKATRDELKEIFAGARLNWADGGKVQVVDQPESDLGKKFYAGFVGKSILQVRTQWTKLVLSGQASAPTKCTDDDAVKKAVASNPNAVGFISTKALDGTVKEIGNVE